MSKVERIVKLELALQQMMAQLQQTRDVMEKFAKKLGYEYSLDQNDWILKNDPPSYKARHG